MRTWITHSSIRYVEWVYLSRVVPPLTLSLTNTDKRWRCQKTETDERSSRGKSVADKCPRTAKWVITIHKRKSRVPTGRFSLRAWMYVCAMTVCGRFRAHMHMRGLDNM
ncbi:hypothetical protein BDN70DRAFT_297749 [Pholiota conissans]|uniref:Uncharacterized protein n=1 Tax=Pholiota conissans TaxID=109636 RepID=A0A9P6CVZ8_9AGAR|nr:hypothetical protein BDN70DRAFT_297749 [Pholiota conissans]